MSISYLGIIIITLVIGLGAQAMIKSAYKKWSQVRNDAGLTGYQAARNMLDNAGLFDVGIDCIQGELTDNFNPRDNMLHLSQAVYNSSSVSAVAIACHEAGHAIQYATGYGPIKIRTSIVPAVSLASNIWPIILIIGIFVSSFNLIIFGVILYAVVVVFHLVTLPVEFDASNRAINSIEAAGALSVEQCGGAKSVLRAAAMTYVAAALSSLLQLLYFLSLADRG